MDRKFKHYLGIIINALALACFLFMVTTGILMKYILPPGSGHSKAILSLGRHDWGDVHFWLAVIFFSLLALHLILHWSWIINTLKGKSRSFQSTRFRLGLAGFIIVMLLSVIPFTQPISEKDGGGDHEHQNEGQGQEQKKETKNWPATH